MTDSSHSSDPRDHYGHTVSVANTSGSARITTFRCVDCGTTLVTDEDTGAGTRVWKEGDPA